MSFTVGAASSPTAFACVKYFERDIAERAAGRRAIPFQAHCEADWEGRKEGLERTLRSSAECGLVGAPLLRLPAGGVCGEASTFHPRRPVSRISVRILDSSLASDSMSQTSETQRPASSFIGLGRVSFPCTDSFSQCRRARDLEGDVVEDEEEVDGVRCRFLLVGSFFLVPCRKRPSEKVFFVPRRA